jgi:hypothetical protein
MGDTMTRTEKILKYIIQRHSDAVGNTRLAKYIYMTDYLCRKYLGHAVSDLQYRLLLFGPFDPKLYEALQNLRMEGQIDVYQYLSSGRVGFAYVDIGPPVELDLTDAERLILDYVLDAFHRRPLKELLEDVVYETEPVKEALERGASGEPLEMDRINNTGREELGGLDLEVIMRSEKAAAEGRLRPLSDVFRDLQTAHRRAS